MKKLSAGLFCIFLAAAGNFPVSAQTSAQLKQENKRLKAQVTELQAAQQNKTVKQSSESVKRSFFDRLGEQISKATGVSSARPEGNESNSGTAIYTPASSTNTFEGIFSHGNRDLALQGRLQWPRVALTFVEYGESLPCWTVDARIWTSALRSTTERFQTCLNAPLTKVDDMGRTNRFDKRDALTRAKLSRFESAQPLFGYVDTTGTKRTEGPNPPRKLFMVDVDGEMEDKVFDAAINAMWVSGFFTLEDTAMTSSFFDWRMWIAGFNPAGHRGR